MMKFDTEKFIFNVEVFMLEEEREKNDDDYSSIKYRKFLSNNLGDTDFCFLFNKKAIIFYAKGVINDQYNSTYALSYIKFKKIIVPK